MGKPSDYDTGEPVNHGPEGQKVWVDREGDLWIGERDDEDATCWGTDIGNPTRTEGLVGALKEANESALMDALETHGVLEGTESGAERFEDAQEWYDALESAAAETFPDGYDMATTEYGDHDAVVVAATCENVRGAPFFDVADLAYVKANPEDDRMGSVFEDADVTDPLPDYHMDNGNVAFYVDAPEHVDVRTVEDPEPSPEDVAETWIEAVDDNGNVAYFPLNDNTEVVEGENPIFGPLAVKSNLGIRDHDDEFTVSPSEFDAESVEAVEASEVPDVEVPSEVPVDE